MPAVPHTLGGDFQCHHSPRDPLSPQEKIPTHPLRPGAGITASAKGSWCPLALSVFPPALHFLGSFSIWVMTEVLVSRFPHLFCLLFARVLATLGSGPAMEQHKLIREPSTQHLSLSICQLSMEPGY